MEFRIGIHMGDIRVEGERIFGDGGPLVEMLELLSPCSRPSRPMSYASIAGVQALVESRGD